MASSARKKAAATQKRLAAGRKPTTTRKRRTRTLIDDVTAILLISPNAKRLCKFYRATLGIPLEEEVHDGIPLHYGYSLGDVHFAIHNADGWPGVPTRNAQSPIISFSTSNLKAVAARLSASGVKVTGPTDHGFAHAVSFRDPDGNHVSIFEYRPEYWYTSDLTSSGEQDLAEGRHTAGTKSDPSMKSRREAKRSAGNMDRSEHYPRTLQRVIRLTVLKTHNLTTFQKVASLQKLAVVLSASHFRYDGATRSHVRSDVLTAAQ